MNQYNNNYGYHSPKESEQLAQLLIAEGIPFEDISWHNDATDSFQIDFDNEFKLVIWIGDKAQEDDDDETMNFSKNSLVKRHNESFDLDHDIPCGNSFSEIIAKIKEIKGIGAN